jgi:hypothetical protein
MSEKEESNIIDFSKSQKRRSDIKNGVDANGISDEDFQVFLKAFFGPYKGGGYNPE